MRHILFRFKFLFAPFPTRCQISRAVVRKGKARVYSKRPYLAIMSRTLIAQYHSQTKKPLSETSRFLLKVCYFQVTRSAERRWVLKFLRSLTNNLSKDGKYNTTAPLGLMILTPSPAQTHETIRGLANKGFFKPFYCSYWPYRVYINSLG